LSVRLADRMEKLGSLLTVPMKFYIWVVFENLSRKFNFHYIQTRKADNLHEDQYTFPIYLAQFFLEWEMFQTKVVEKFKTHILCSIKVFRILCRLWEMWKNIVEPNVLQTTIRRKRITCWISKATNTHP
jgi:hypothetical protein